MTTTPSLPARRRLALRTVPRAAAALLALLLSVLAGPRGGAEDRRAERLSGEAALISPIFGPLNVRAWTVNRGVSAQSSAPHVVDDQPCLGPCRNATVSAVACVRPMRSSSVAARAP